MLSRQDSVQATRKERPYRSRLQPACQSCRQRKSRCTLKSGADTCLSCQVHGTSCSFTSASPRQQIAARADEVEARATKRNRASANEVQMSSGCRSSGVGIDAHRAQHVYSNASSLSTDAEQDENLLTNLGGDLAEGEDDVAHVVGPITAFDNDILENYLSSISATTTSYGYVSPAAPRSSVQASTPIVFDTIRKRPVGAPDRQSLAASKCEVIEQLIGPHTMHVVELHLRFVNRNFPLLEEGSFRNLYRDAKSRISPALLCSLYASSLSYWRQSSGLSTQRCPENRFVWVQAGEALYSEMFLAPGMSVIIAMLLHVNGRPSTSMLGNGGLTGFAASLAYSLGLNRNPRDWQIPQSEKRLRIRIWWMIVIFDKWFSFGYGTPSRIKWSQFDVPYPSLEELDCSTNDSTQDKTSGTMYIALLALTETLDKYLDFVYCLNPVNNQRTSHSSNDLELLLTQWEESLDDEPREIIIHKTSLELQGAANFRLAYLGVRLFLCKIQLDLEIKSQPLGTQLDQGPISRRFTQSQRAAEDIVHFVKHLTKEQLVGFWSPISAFALTSATTFLLRNALRSAHGERNVPLKMVKEFVNILQQYHHDFDWDMPGHCLKRWAHVVDRISSLDEPNLETHGPWQEDLGMNQWELDDLFSDMWGVLPG